MAQGASQVQIVAAVIGVALVLQHSVWFVSTATTPVDTDIPTTVIDTTTVSGSIDTNTGSPAINGTNSNDTDTGNSTASSAGNGTQSSNDTSVNGGMSGNGTNAGNGAGNGQNGTTQGMPLAGNGTRNGTWNGTTTMGDSGNSVTTEIPKKKGGIKKAVIIGLSAGFGFGILTCIFVIILWNCCCNRLCGDAAAQIVPIDLRGEMKETDDI